MNDTISTDTSGIMRTRNEIEGRRGDALIFAVICTIFSLMVILFLDGDSMLEKTICGAKHIDYPDFKVWILDDGQRQWLAELLLQKCK